MSFKTILVHIDDSQRCKHRLDAAIRLAIDFRADLVGIYLVPGAELTPTIAALLPGEVVAQRLRDTGETQDRAEITFRETAATAGLTAIEWRAPAGRPVDAAVAHARCADLFVIGQRSPDDVDSVFAEELAATVVLAAGRPTLIVPYTGLPRTLGQNVLVAWDGGREAARAIADALPLLARAKQVIVMSISPGAGERVVDAQAESRLAAYLRRHGIDPRVNRYEVPDISVGEWLLSRAADLGTDLIVMGGYGHTRLRELVLGGVTRTMLSSMTVPVLMSH